MTILGVAKLLGAIALILARLPMPKEWAYAGFTSDLPGVSASHAFVQNSISETVPPIVVPAFAIASYVQRPANRRLLSIPNEQGNRK